MAIRKEVPDTLSVHNGIGKIDEKGHWKPNDGYAFSPLFNWPIKPLAMMKFLFGPTGYVVRYLLYVMLAIATYKLLENDLKNFKGITIGWILLMHLRNQVMLWWVYGGYHLLLYTLKVQGNVQKYNPKWQQTSSKRFMWNNQVLDNVFRSSVISATFWTAYEVFYIWGYSKGFTPLINFDTNPVYFVLLFFLIPIIKEVHFYTIHKILHKGWLMRKVHSVHHMNPNPGPWSGLAMHPVEGFFYFSVLLMHFIIPSHPIHFFFTSQLTALSPAGVHTGFEGPLFGRKFLSGDYFHYLHHKHVSCNYGGGTIPMDRWFGRFYSGKGPYKTVRVIKKK